MVDRMPLTCGTISTIEKNDNSDRVGLKSSITSRHGRERHATPGRGLCVGHRQRHAIVGRGSDFRRFVARVGGVCCMQYLRLYIPTAMLFLVSPVHAAAPSNMSASEPATNNSAPAMGGEQQNRLELSAFTSALRKAAEQGDADSQAGLGAAYFSGLGVPQDYAEAMRWYRKAADQGDARAQVAVGWMYATGTGVPQNYTEAVKWIRKSADQGYGWAQSVLGSMYFEGTGVVQDYTEAFKWFQRAAEQGDAEGQYNLGWMYAQGIGIPRDYAEAARWYRKAAEQGNTGAQSNLGSMILEGKGVVQNDAEAVAWFLKAADQGDVNAQFNLGLMYSEGRGVTRDSAEAAKWFRKAAQSLGRSRWMRIILLVLLLLILPPVVIVVLLLIVSRRPRKKPSPATGVAEESGPVAAAQPRYPDILAELASLQNKRTSWTSAILVLMVSFALFVAVGAGTSSWELLIMIVGILFLHEAGHYMAMRIFHYRNVRMFFIPFLGAAVSGQNYAAPGWKKVTVALMGPLPGILLGSAIGLAGLIWGNRSLTKIAMTAIIFNGFQLLPVLPLDGGQVMHELLFSRDHRLDAVFRALAAATLAGIGLLSADWMFLFLGLFMLGGVQHEYKTGRIAAELRRQGILGSTPTVSQSCESVDSLPAMPHEAPRSLLEPGDPQPATPPTLTEPTSTLASAAAGIPTPASAEEESIPRAVAEKIIERVKACFPQFDRPKQVAGLTLRVYEKLVTRPPGIRASIGFMSVHYALYVITLVSISLVTLTGGM